MRIIANHTHEILKASLVRVNVTQKFWKPENKSGTLHDLNIKEMWLVTSSSLGNGNTLATFNVMVI